MNLYRIFLISFIVSFIALVVFLYYYSNFFILFMTMMNGVNHSHEVNPAQIISILFTPQIIISAIVMGLSSLAYKVLGILLVSRNPTLGSSEKVLWILGFIFMGFVTVIVFMALKNSRNLLAVKQHAVAAERL